MSRTRNVILWFAISALFVLVGGLLVILVHPVLLTGRSYEITVRKVEFGPGGMVSVTYDDVLTYDTQVLTGYSANRGTTFILEGWEGRPRSFLRWPTKERDKNLTLYVSTEDERTKGIGDSPAIRRRWLMQEGTYRIRSGDRMVISRYLDADGTSVESTIEVAPSR